MLKVLIKANVVLSGYDKYSRIDCKAAHLNRSVEA